MAWKLAGNIGARIRELRKVLSQTQEQFGELAGVEGQQVSEWENRRSKPSQARLERLARRLGIPIAVFEEGGPMPSASAMANGRPEGDGEETAPDEEQFRDFLRNIERTSRAIVGDPTLWSAEEHRINQLGVVRAIMRKAAEAGRPIPDWLPKIYNELVGGTFR